MFEDKTTDNLLTTMLANVSDTYEKSAGYPTYDFLKSFAIELASAYTNLQTIYNKLDVDLLTGDELTKYVKQRKGIIRKPAGFATGTLSITGTGNIKIGDLFETATGIQFKAIEAKTITNTGTVKIQALIAGESGNVGANSIIQMPVTIAGISGCTNPSATMDGYVEETDTELRERYYEALQQPPTSGNKYHYISWAKEIVGVGDAKVFPLWNGANTVKVIIIDSNKQPASTAVVNSVQAYIDPNSSGNGSGVAPIGAYCTVVSATGLNINISVTVVKATNYTVQEVTTNISDRITAYLKSIAFKQDYVSYAQIGNAIIDSAGVLDYSNLTINGGTSNVSIGTEQVAILGTVNVT